MRSDPHAVQYKTAELPDGSKLQLWGRGRIHKIYKDNACLGTFSNYRVASIQFDRIKTEAQA